MLGDIYAHLGDTTRATQVYEDAITRNPDNDQDYLSLALLQLRENSVADAKQTLLRGQARRSKFGKNPLGPRNRFSFRRQHSASR